jgi:hypothetical protein
MAKSAPAAAIAIHTAAAVLAVVLIGQSPSPAAAQSCRDSVGAKKAALYVDQCKQVSPATHPPCNASNSCDLIISEIRRGCAFIGAGAPRFCAAYKN